MSELAPAACRNCGAAAGGTFCPECGQETALHPPSAREFLHEFIGHYIALEGALWHTLAALMRPGKLTNEYFAGRRRRYVLPLRLYLTASIIFFLVAKGIMPTPEVRASPGAVSAAGGAAVLHCAPGETLCERLNAGLRERFGNLSRAQLVSHAMERALERVVALFPYAMFILLPVFALLTRVAYWTRPFNYGEHLVFAFHVHAFAFFVGTLVAPFGYPTLLTVPVAIYLAVALNKVFGGRQWTSIARFLFIFVTYFVILLATLIAIMLAAIIL